MVMSSQGFQTFVGTVPSPAVEGDFSDTNPRYMVDAGPGGLVVGAFGATVARFGWLANDALDPDNARKLVNNFGTGLPAGIIHREQQGLNTTYLAEASMGIPTGFALTLMSGGGIWVRNAGTTLAKVGDACYAAFVDGSASFVLGGATATDWNIAAETTTFTGSITGNVMTAGTVAGTVYPDSIVTGSGVATGTAVGDQLLPLLAGEALAGAGRYYVSIAEQAVASTAITLTYGLLTVTTATAGKFAAGQTLAASTIDAGTYVTQLVSGDGGTGSTLAVNLTQTLDDDAGGTLTGALNVATSFVARSSGGAGELVKISNQPTP